VRRHRVSSSSRTGAPAGSAACCRPTCPSATTRCTATGAPPVTVIVSPGRCLPHPGRLWGWAVQTYALRSATAWGVGDLGDLARFGHWARAVGAGFALINPLDAAIPERPRRTSPYYPSSRRFRDLLYLDVDGRPGYRSHRRPAVRSGGRGRRWARPDRPRRRDGREAPRAGVAVVGGRWLRPRGGLRGLPRRTGPRAGTVRHVRDPGRAPRLRVAVVAGGLPRSGRCRGHRLRGPACRSDRLPRVAASGCSTSSCVAPGRADPADARPADRGRSRWRGRVGVAGRAVRARRDRRSAARRARTGRGRTGVSRPSIPWKLRQAAYRPWIETMRASFRHAAALRIDHVLGLFRLFWIPPDGPKVGELRRPGCARALLDILALESHRADASPSSRIGASWSRARSGGRATSAVPRSSLPP
jgi:4-alpha-glucanotransferase